MYNFDYLASRNILITGGCGFIGRNLIKLLLGNGVCNIRVIDNLSTGDKGEVESLFANLEPTPHGSMGVELRIGDIRDEKFVLDSLTDIEYIVHLAANTGVDISVKQPEQDISSNVIGTFNLLEASKKHKIKKFILASSNAPIGFCEPPINENVAPHPQSPYGASKLACEGYCSAYYYTYDIDTVMMRFSNVYGPGSLHKTSIIAKFINKIIKGENIEIFGDGNQTRDFIYVDDLIFALVLALQKTNIGGQLFQIASSTETTINDVTHKLVNILKDKGYSDTKIIYKEQRKGDIYKNYSSIDKAKHILQWNPSVDLDRGLRSTVDWFLNNTGNRE